MEAEREEEVTRLRAMLRAEAQAKAWRSIKSVTESSAFNSVTRVEVPLVDGMTQECTTKETVERGIARENSKRFGMASHAPVCHGALFELLGYSADTETAENILRRGRFTHQRTQMGQYSYFSRKSHGYGKRWETER